MPASVTKMKTDNQSQVTPEVQSESAAKADDAVQTGKGTGIDTARPSVVLKLFLLLRLIKPFDIHVNRKNGILLRLSQRMLNPDENSRCGCPDIPDIADRPAEPGEPDASRTGVSAADRSLRYSNTISSAADNFSAPADRFDTSRIFSGLFGSASSIIEELEKRG